MGMFNCQLGAMAFKLGKGWPNTENGSSVAGGKSHVDCASVQ